MLIELFSVMLERHVRKNAFPRSCGSEAPIKVGYSPAKMKLPTASVTALVGVGIAGLVLLPVQCGSVTAGDNPATVSAAAVATGMFLASMLYHAIPPSTRTWLKKFNHRAIYLLDCRNPIRFAVGLISPLARAR